MEVETSLEPYYLYHYCFECGHFHRKWFDTDGFNKNYCLKLCRTVNKDKKAYWCFSFRVVAEGWPDLLAWRWADNLWLMGRVVNLIVKMGRCYYCGREFTYRVTNPKDIKKYCCIAHKYKDKRFCKQMDKNSRLGLEKYFIYRWKERVLHLHAR
jgi:hypothetical protein